MKRSIALVVLLIVLLVLPNITVSRHITRPRFYRNGHRAAQGRMRGNMNTRGRPAMKPRGPGPDTVEIAGSSLPDCSHACGSCSPCRLVMVSFVCASREEAETCPMAYKCMCKNKSYPVP
ncbi:protein EPIDERMAL PATTERNING FACTOR 1-like [Chenopodium quinoa]|uniref:Epidermal patterning factor-like protein n=1 Tax=Chenopodium quinoa TaxID=63459 RepID=A0A803LH76_CHEQI|nr:protein EPIDERMAL PATTERNING FACTOR 1-like [Chenopodium quinoa]